MQKNIDKSNEFEMITRLQPYHCTVFFVMDRHTAGQTAGHICENNA